MLNNPAINSKIGNLSSSQAGIGVIEKFIGNFISFAFGIAAIILLFMVIRGGYEYVSSGGDKEGTEKAKKRITTGLIGICILFSAYAILAIVGTVFGINVTQLIVPTVNN